DKGDLVDRQAELVDLVPKRGGLEALVHFFDRFDPVEHRPGVGEPSGTGQVLQFDILDPDDLKAIFRTVRLKYLDPVSSLGLCRKGQAKEKYHKTNYPHWSKLD